MRNGNITKTGIFLLLVAGLPLAVAADADEWVAVGSQPSAAETAPPNRPNSWIDRRHDAVSSRIDRVAHHWDSWFGTPDPNKPADAGLRVILDTEWNKHDRFSVKPRIRGRLKLPVLEN